MERSIFVYKITFSAHSHPDFVHKSAFIWMRLRVMYVFPEFAFGKRSLLLGDKKMIRLFQSVYV